MARSSPVLPIVGPALPVFAPALPVEPTEPFALALVLPVAPREPSVEPAVPVVPRVPVEPALLPADPAVPVVSFGVVVLVVAELLGRVPVVLLCPVAMALGFVVEFEPGLAEVDCPTVLAGVAPVAAPGVPAVLPG